MLPQHELEDMMPREISQTQKDKYSVAPSIRGARSGQTVEPGCRLRGAGAGVGGSQCFMGTEFLLGKMSKLWR